MGKACYFFEEKILVIADLHLGYEEMLNQQGILIPKHQFKETIQDLDRIFNYLKENRLQVKELVILGDLKHEFSSNLSQEWREVHELLDYLKEKTKKVIIIKGNHDNYLTNVVRDKAKIVDYYVKNEIGFTHGDKSYLELLDKKIKILVLGHKHPAVTLEKSSKKERYKCFLAGKWENKEVIILPSFFPLVEGSDVNIEDTNFAFKFNLKKFKVYIPIPGEVKVLEFEKLKD